MLPGGEKEVQHPARLRKMTELEKDKLNLLHFNA